MRILHVACIDWTKTIPSNPALISQIEAMTPDAIQDALRSAGIYGGSGLKHYRQAKRVIFQGQWIDSAIYDRHIEAILAYIT